MQEEEYDDAPYWDDEQDEDFIDEDQIMDVHGRPIVRSHTYEH